MAESKTSRLLQLVLCLTRSGRPLPKDRLRAAIPDYAECPTDEAFERMFERDKAELRELGVPLATVALPGAGEEDVGYRIDPEESALPPLRLTGPEMTAAALAAQVWSEAGLAEEANRALRKLAALGTDADAELPAVRARLVAGEAAFAPLTAALADRAAVAFDYQGVADAAPAPRHVHPWGVVSHRGRWYLVGYDVDRGDTRVFRLSRVVGEVRREGPAGVVEVPAGEDLRARVDAFEGSRPLQDVVLALRPGAGHGLRARGGAGAREGIATVLPAARPGRRPAGVADDDDLLALQVSDLDVLAGEVAGYGPSVLVVDPPALRDAVVRRLAAAADARSGGGHGHRG